MKQDKERRANVKVGFDGWSKMRVGEDGIDVTVEDVPIPFSPFSSADCTMLNHFSFNDFVAIAFPDIAGDLDVQI